MQAYPLLGGDGFLRKHIIAAIALLGVQVKH